MRDSGGSKTSPGVIGSTAATSRVSDLALIGSPPESRGYRGRGHRPIIRGARIEAFVTVDAGKEKPTLIGKSWVMKGCHVGHDAVIGDDCELAPHVIIGGYAVIQRGVRIGMGAIIRNRVIVGAGARIGMGAVVTKDVPPGETWVGNPARNIDTDPRIDPLWDEWFDSRG